MRITKKEAKEIAMQLLQEKKDEFSIKIKELEVMVRDEYLKKLPEDIVSCFVKHESYFPSTYFCASFINFGNNRAYTFTLKPSTYHSRCYSSVDFSSDIINLDSHLKALANKISKAEDELTEYLYKLGTPEKINKQFPDVKIKQKETQVTLITPDLLSWIKS